MNDSQNTLKHVNALRVGVGVLFLVLWEVLGRTYGHTWTSLPSLIALKAQEVGIQYLLYHTGITLLEVFAGFAIGGAAGVLAGVVFGRVTIVADIFAPLVTILYTIPLVTLVPLLILWFGLDLAPKIILVAIVVFFLMFFNVFAGARLVDNDILDALKLMGSGRLEQFVKVELPSVQTWIFTGAKVAVPYALVAATTAEIMASRAGLGFIVAQASSRLDMPSLYMALFVLMIIGLLCTQLVQEAENRMLVWKKRAV